MIFLQKEGIFPRGNKLKFNIYMEYSNNIMKYDNVFNNLKFIW